MSSIQQSLKLLKTHGFNTSNFLKCWHEPLRVYHGISHIEAMLNHVINQSNFHALNLDQQIILHLGAWYHDMVYLPGSKYNEEDSAELAIKELKGELASLIANMVMATKTHTLPEHYLSALLIDADLADLGTTAYAVNAFAVKQEYPNITNEQWVKGRIAFLTSMLNRPSIYLTAWGSRFETEARYNITKEHSVLSTYL